MLPDSWLPESDVELTRLYLWSLVSTLLGSVSCIATCFFEEIVARVAVFVLTVVTILALNIVVCCLYARKHAQDQLALEYSQLPTDLNHQQPN